MPDLKLSGLPINKAEKAAIMIHGRGASATSILSLNQYLKLDDFALLAPQAEMGTWYPYSFMAPDQQNKLALEKSIKVIQETWEEVMEAGIKPENVYFIGFSQGACLSLEFATRNAQKLGGVIAFTGGLIGEKIQTEKYRGDFLDTPVFIGSSNRDFHVPAERISESADLISKMGGKVKTLLFDDPEHTIREEEIDWVNRNILM